MFWATNKGRVYKCKSFDDAEMLTNIHRKVIGRMLRNNKPYSGWMFYF